MSKYGTEINEIAGIIRKQIHWNCECSICEGLRNLLDSLVGIQKDLSDFYAYQQVNRRSLAIEGVDSGKTASGERNLPLASILCGCEHYELNHDENGCKICSCEKFEVKI